MRKLHIIVPLLALALAACGGPSTSLHVIMTDFAFTPNSFTVPAGQTISVEFTNNGAATHSFIIMKAGTQVQGHFGDADRANVYWEEAAVAPGQSAKASFMAPSEPGQYQILCDIPAHLESGMVATLTVVKGP